MRWTVCCQRPLLNLGLRRVGGNGEKPSSAAITAALHLIIAESAAHKPSSRHQRALPQRPMPSTITRAPMHSSLNDTSDEIHLLRPRTLIKGTRRRDRRCRRRRRWRRGRGRWALAATAVALGGTGGGGDGDGGRGIGGADGSVPWGTDRAVRVGVGRAHPTDVQHLPVIMRVE